MDENETWQKYLWSEFSIGENYKSVTPEICLIAKS